MLLSASWWVVASASSHSLLLLLLLYAKTVKLRCMLCLWWLLEPPGSVITGLGMHEIRSIACRWIGATTELCHFPAYMRSANVQGLMASKAKQVGMGWSDRSGAEEDKDGRIDANHGWMDGSWIVVVVLLLQGHRHSCCCSHKRLVRLHNWL
jgi:hypothetical protein